MHDKRQVISILIVFLYVGAFFIACQTAAGRTAGEVVDDSTVTAKIKAKLFEDKQLSGFAISVVTFEGEVTLTGAVPSQDQKSRAALIAKSVQGVRKVNNLLKLKAG